MQNVDPKDKPKLYGLIAGAVVAFIFVGKTLYDAIVPPVPPPAPPKTEASPIAGAPAGGTGVAGGTNPNPQASPSPGIGFFPDQITPRFGRDPFAPVPDDVLAQESQPMPTKPIATQTTPAPSIVNILPGVGSGIRGVPVSITKALVDLRKRQEDIKKLNDELEKNGNGIVAPDVTILKPDAPPYTVTGVMIGEPGGNDVAILRRTGSDERRFVVVGDSIGNGFKVTAIESDGIRVKNPGQGLNPMLHGNPVDTGTSGTEVFIPRQGVAAKSVTLPLGGIDTPKAK